MISRTKSETPHVVSYSSWVQSGNSGFGEFSPRPSPSDGERRKNLLTGVTQAGATRFAESQMADWKSQKAGAEGVSPLTSEGVSDGPIPLLCLVIPFSKWTAVARPSTQQGILCPLNSEPSWYRRLPRREVCRQCASSSRFIAWAKRSPSETMPAVS